MESELDSGAIGSAYDRPYETLGVPRAAPDDEISGAYYWLARRHTPENKRQEFARISAAYRLLADPGSRRRFDARERFTDADQQALDQAERALDKAPRQTAQAAEAIVVDTGRSEHVRIAAASLCVMAGAPAPAVAYLSDVVTRSRNDVEAICRLAEAYVASGEPTAAGVLLQEATVRHPRESELLVGLAHARRGAGDLDQAEAALRSAVKIAEVRKARSVPLQFMRLALLAESGLFARMHGVASEIRLALKNGDEQLERHVVTRYANWATAATTARSYELAGFLLDRACEIDATDDLVRQRDEVAPLAVAQQEAHAAFGRKELADWIKALLHAALGGQVQAARLHALLTAARRGFAAAPQTAHVEWLRFESDYPAAARVLKRYRDQIQYDVESAAEETARAAAAPVAVAPVAAPHTPAPAPRHAATKPSGHSPAGRTPGKHHGTRPGTRAGRRPGDRPSTRNRRTAGASVGGIVLMVIVGIFGKSCVRQMLRPTPTPQQQLDQLIPRVDYSDPAVQESVDRLNRMTAEERDAYFDELHGRDGSRGGDSDTK